MKELERSEVHLWSADLADFDLCLVYDKHVDWLNAEEKERMHRYQSLFQREHFVLGRVLLRLILSKYLDCEPSEFNFHTDKQGKLFLNSQRSLYFNLSHSYERLVVAVSRARYLGVDIELMDEKRATLKIAERYFSASEFQDLCKLPKSLQAGRFYELWTLKESVLKALGVGLAGRLSKVKFAFPSSKKLDMQFVLAKQDSTRWQSWQLKAGDSYALALSAKPLGARINQIESQTLMSFDQVRPEVTQIIRSLSG